MSTLILTKPMTAENLTRRLHAVKDIDRYTEEGGGTRWTARARVIIVRYRRGQATHQQGNEAEQTGADARTGASKAGGAGADAGNGADASTITCANIITNTGTRQGDLIGASQGARRGADPARCNCWGLKIRALQALKFCRLEGTESCRIACESLDTRCRNNIR